MEPISTFMEQDHDHLDDCFKRFQAEKMSDTKAALRDFAEFRTHLQRHIVWEEEFLFPLFESHTGIEDGGPTSVMRLEHRRIKELLDAIHDRVAAGKMDTDDEEHALKDVLLVHNTKEEVVLYPAIDRCVSETEATKLIETMQDLPAERYARCCSGTH